jgi:outer membrane protein assembly factor BamA
VQAQKKIIAHNNITGLADSTKKVCIKEIDVTGNKRTKLFIILRELPFAKGDSIAVSQLTAQLEQARKQVYNTSLFEMTKVEAVITSPSTVNITITVNERWYILPVPQFQLVDRNFNVWYKTFHRNLNRVNYGIKFSHNNLTGKRDKLNIFLINGYSRNISFNYSNPNIDAAHTRGFAVAAGYTQNREISYKTSGKDSVLFYPSDSIRKTTNDFVRNSWYIGATYSIRKGFFTRHYFSASYNFLKVDDSVIIKNHNYFKDSVNAKGFPDLSYTYQYVNVDNNSYSLKGTSFYFVVLKRGLGLTGGLNMLSIEAGLNKYYSLGKGWFANFQLNGKIKLPFDQAYFNQRGLGYGETYLRGLEYNVVDGVAYLLAKSTLKKKLFSFNIPFPFFPKILTKIPFTFFAKTYADFGYVYTKPRYDSYLNNRLLYTGGFGIDILTLYDINLRFEYSINQLNNRGLFFHTQNGF